MDGITLVFNPFFRFIFLFLSIRAMIIVCFRFRRNEKYFGIGIFLGNWGGYRFSLFFGFVESFLEDERKMN